MKRREEGALALIALAVLLLVVAIATGTASFSMTAAINAARRAEALGDGGGVEKALYSLLAALPRATNNEVDCRLDPLFVRAEELRAEGFEVEIADASSPLSLQWLDDAALAKVGDLLAEGTTVDAIKGARKNLDASPALLFKFVKKEAQPLFSPWAPCAAPVADPEMTRLFGDRIGAGSGTTALLSSLPAILHSEDPQALETLAKARKDRAALSLYPFITLWPPVNANLSPQPLLELALRLGGNSDPAGTASAIIAKRAGGTIGREEAAAMAGNAKYWVGSATSAYSIRIGKEGTRREYVVARTSQTERKYRIVGQRIPE